MNRFMLEAKVIDSCAAKDQWFGAGRRRHAEPGLEREPCFLEPWRVIRDEIDLRRIDDSQAWLKRISKDRLLALCDPRQTGTGQQLAGSGLLKRPNLPERATCLNDGARSDSGAMSPGHHAPRKGEVEMIRPLRKNPTEVLPCTA